MTPERWQQVEHVYQVAVARPEPERARVIAMLCAGDDGLRREVESLLAHAGDASAFLEGPGLAGAGFTDPSSFVGRRFGSFVVRSPLGAGGMGEVYRAHDEQLGREVAIKVLPRLFADDPERLTRFTSEARILAALNHPHIAAIYGLEQVDGSPALVLELVEGETLAQRIEKGALPLADTLMIAKQVAGGLEAAHERGIVHRDLKPANIKLTPDGVVKILDFGLAALATHESGGSRTDITSSPTVVGDTRPGIILGTAAYMSPEQARGLAVDRRADIWAFGCLCFEMVTGRQAFAGDTVTDSLAAILEREPPWTLLPSATPPAVRRLLRRCLEKDRRLRLNAIGDARLELDDATAPADRDSGLSHAAAVPSRRRALPWALAGALGIALVAALVAALVPWLPMGPAAVPAPRRLLSSIGADASLATDVGASAILSPDGTTLVFVAAQAGETKLFIRKLEQLQASALAGTEGAASPFFSPDGQWLGFFAAGSLKKIPVAGGTAITLLVLGPGAAALGRGGTWTEDGSVIYASGNGPQVPLMRVPAAGGTSTVFGTLRDGVTTQRWPYALPKARGVLYTEHSSTNNFDGANLVVVPLAGGTPKVVVRDGYYGRYASSGHIVFMQRGRLAAVPFDLGRLEATGPVVPLLDGVSADPGVSGAAQVALSSEGTLVYVPGAATTTARSIDWMTSDGKTSVLRAAKADWSNPRFSPDGQKLAVEIFDGTQYDIWVYEWALDTLTQLTFHPGADRWPVWTPDGRRITFSSDRSEGSGIPGEGTASAMYWVNADGTGGATRLTVRGAPWSWHPSGQFVAFMADQGNGRRDPDLWLLSMEGDAARGWTSGQVTTLLSTPEFETYPVFSPDGRWVAYYSNGPGNRKLDVYVRPFPGPGGPWRISTEGGWFPQWSTTTPELMFIALDGTVMAASYAVAGNSFRAQTPRIWSPVRIRGTVPLNSAYDLHPDGKRIAVAGADDQDSVVQDKVVFVTEFFDHLRTIAPGRD